MQDRRDVFISYAATPVSCAIDSRSSPANQDQGIMPQFVNENMLDGITECKQRMMKGDLKKALGGII
jgi:hypothetical protein